MTNESCAAKAEEQAAIAAETARLKREWAELKLETMEKTALTEQDFTTVARYLCSYNRQTETFHHDAVIRQGLPLKLGTYTKETRRAVLQEARDIGRGTEASGSGRTLTEVEMAAEYCPGIMGKMAKDSESLMRWLLPRRAFWHEWQTGLFTKARIDEWHSDGPEKPTDSQPALGEPMFLARINLPMHFRRENGEEFISDDNGLYLVATKYRRWNLPPGAKPFVEGTIHRSAPVTKPTPSLFLRVSLR